VSVPRGDLFERKELMVAMSSRGLERDNATQRQQLAKERATKVKPEKQGKRSLKTKRSGRHMIESEYLANAN